jgi:predicted nucleotidyltransferase component of viral defense system
MDILDFTHWVHQSPDSSGRIFRQAIHTLILAISKSRILQGKMVMRGGILLAVRFKSPRYTIDIDFATPDRYTNSCEDAFVNDLKESLVLACEELPYDLDCRVQGADVQPPGEGHNFQTLKIRMGYARKGTSEHKRLMVNNCPHVIKIDYNFNEPSHLIDTLQITDGGEIKVYSVVDLLAEKYRAILQQEIRKRSRRQDAYDIYHLLENENLDDDSIKREILNALILKAKSRNLEIDKDSLSNKNIIGRSEANYPKLAQEIEGDLLPFNTVYSRVKEYYELLPWPSTGGV